MSGKLMVMYLGVGVRIFRACGIHVIGVGIRIIASLCEGGGAKRRRERI